MLTNQAGWIAGALLVAASGVGLFGLFESAKPGGWWLRWTVACWIMWATLPPLFFLLQWSFLDAWRGRDAARAEAVENLKYSHDLAAKFWLGGITVLSGVLIETHHLGNEGGASGNGTAAVSASSHPVR